MNLDPLRVTGSARDLLRPIDWRDRSPDAAALRECLVFPRERSVASFDGTEIAYSVFGRSGPWVALVPGFCCPDNFWTYLVPALRGDHRVIVFDLRGLGASGLPRSPGYRARNLSPRDFAIEHHAADLLAVLDDAGARKATLVGHSMGGQTILEAYRSYPARVGGLVFLTAPFETPLRTFYGRDFHEVFRGLYWAIASMPRATILLWRSLFLTSPALTHAVARFTHALGPGARREDMEPYYRHLAMLDPLVVLKMAQAMRKHSAADVLAGVRVPTLIVAGSADTFTPLAVAETMHAQIPRSELVVLEGAGHGAVIERPEEVNRAVRSFLDRARRPAGSRARTGP